MESGPSSKRKRFLDKVANDYILAEHSVRVRRSGAVCDVLSWWNVQHRDDGRLRGGGENGATDDGDTSRREIRLGRTISINAFNEVWIAIKDNHFIFVITQTRKLFRYYSSIHRSFQNL